MLGAIFARIFRVLPRFSGILPKFLRIFPGFLTTQNIWGRTFTPWTPISYTTGQLSQTQGECLFSANSKKQ